MSRDRSAVPDPATVQRWLAAPLLAALLDRLEYQERRRLDPSEFSPFEALPDAAAPAVARAAASAATVRLPVLLQLAADAAAALLNPHIPGQAATNVLLALALAPERRDVLEALLSRPDAAELSGPGTSEQWSWEFRKRPPPEPMITTSPVDHDTARVLGSTLDFPPPISVWSWTPSASERRIYEVTGEDDLVRLLRKYPRLQRGGYWNLYPDQYPEAEALLRLPGQQAASQGWKRQISLDYPAMSADWDAVHVTWSGWLATEGRVLDLGDGAVSVVAEQRGEHTSWLRPGLVEPRLLFELDSDDLCPDFP